MSNELLYGLGAIVVAVLAMIFGKTLGGKKGKVVPAEDTKKAADAMNKAAKLLGQRALIEAEAEADKKRIVEKLEIKDPVERLTAIADELKDL